MLPANDTRSALPARPEITIDEKGELVLAAEGNSAQAVLAALAGMYDRKGDRDTAFACESLQKMVNSSATLSEQQAKWVSHEAVSAVRNNPKRGLPNILPLATYINSCK